MDDPFFGDAGSESPQNVLQMPPAGNAAILEFVGDKDTNWTLPLKTVLRASKGFGKSHLLAWRSNNHRKIPIKSRILFYPTAGARAGERGTSALVEKLVDSIDGALPSWLDSKHCADEWAKVWQICLIGQLVSLTGAPTQPFEASYLDAFRKMPEFEPAATTGAATEWTAKKQLAWFLKRLLTRLDACTDRSEGVKLLEKLAFEATSEWADAALKSLRNLGYEYVAIYLDNPDELLRVHGHTNAWINLQQGLLIALFQLHKGGTLSDHLRVYSSIRPEAFLAGPTGTNVQQAVNLALDITYTEEHLRDMLVKRIHHLKPDRLALPERLSEDPIAAFTGLEWIRHEDRGFIKESAWSSILRHTRHNPRELMDVAHGIHQTPATSRTQATIRYVVNKAAAENFKYALADSVAGWTPDVEAFAAQLPSEVLDGRGLLARSATSTRDGINPLEVLVRHGFLGFSEAAHNYHAGCFVQRFAYNGGYNPAALDRDFYFVHPCMKEWIDGQLGHRVGMARMQRMTDNLVCDGRLYESAKPPLLLTARDGSLAIVANGDEFVASNPGVLQAPRKFLWLLLYAARQKGEHAVDFGELAALSVQIAKKLGVERSDLCQAFPTTIPYEHRGAYQGWGRESNEFLDGLNLFPKGLVQMRLAQDGGTRPQALLKREFDLRQIAIDPTLVLANGEWLRT